MKRFLFAVVLLAIGLQAAHAQFPNPFWRHWPHHWPHPAPVPAPPQNPGQPQPQPNPPGATTRNAALWPFATNSPWNTPIGSGAMYTGISSPVFKANGGAAINWTSWSHPVFIAMPGDPLRSFFDTDGNTFIATLRTPAATKPDNQQDGSLHVIDGIHAVEMWRASKDRNGNWRASACVATDLTGPGFYEGYHGIRAGGMSALGGLIRKHELAAGNIPHALAVAVQPKALNKNPAFIWPASWADGIRIPGANYGSSGNLHMGALLAIPAGVDIAAMGLSPQGLAVARALQDYGAYITETGSGNVIYYAEPTAAVSSGLSKDLAKLTPLLAIVGNNMPGSVGGGGKPRREAAPPIDLSGF